jgi:hypothetical protein
VTAIVQCYLAAPFMYPALRRMGTNNYLKANLVAGGFLLMVTHTVFVYVPQIHDNIYQSGFINSFLYKDKNFFLASLMIFSLGIAIKPTIDSYRAYIRRWWTLPLAAGVYFFSLYYTR